MTKEQLDNYYDRLYEEACMSDYYDDYDTGGYQEYGWEELAQDWLKSDEAGSVFQD